MNIFYTFPFLVSAVAWAISHSIKFVNKSITEKRIAWEQWVAAGGMPSSHAAIMTSLTFALAIINGTDSSEFALSFVLTVIIMHDASGVRQHAGQQAVIINKILKEVFHGKHPLNQLQKLKEVIGHKPIEVIIGGALGVVVSYLLLFSYSFF